MDSRPGIVGMDYVSLPVEDWEDVVAFYRDLLGLPLLFELPRWWAEFDLGGLRLALYPREPEEGRGGDLGLRVEDLARAKGELERRGGAFPHGVEPSEIPTGRGRLARFRDPSGNRLELVEWTEGRVGSQPRS